MGSVYFSDLAQAVWIVTTGAWSIALYVSQHPKYAATRRARAALAASAFGVWSLAFTLGIFVAEVREIRYAREKAAFTRLLAEGSLPTAFFSAADASRNAQELCGEAVVFGDPKHTPAGIFVDLRVVAVGECPPDESSGQKPAVRGQDK
ncbi:MAG TPA: hypothetical protein ENN00_01670, partial [Bacillaceae bacterium]|nr:hypothetical protein [Bacillaceae bacterium]